MSRIETSPVTPLLSRLAALLGPRGLLTEPGDLAPYLADWRNLYRGRTPCVLRPADTAELAAAVRLCAEAGAPLVPQGGNTSMVGGATPDETGGQIVVSMARMNRIRDLDPVDMTMTAEAGLVLKAAQEAAAAAGCLFPLSLGAEGTATIGGVLSTNAGGNTTVRYGNARELMLGLEVVLPDGQVWNGLRRLRKDNTGYALRHLFVGAEGTLGFITAAVLRLFPRPRETEVAFCAVADEDAALALFRRFRDRDEGAVRAFEYMSGAGVGFAVRHIEGVALPVATQAAHYVLVDLASSRPDAGLRPLLESVLEEAPRAGNVAS
jgi:FAD/FMN-containing dehydrogenase